MQSPQLPLPLRWQQEYAFETFVDALQPGCAGALRRWLATMPTVALVLVGPTGSGKTHLLRAVVAQWIAAQRSAGFWSLRQPELVPAMVEHAASGPIVCDDVDAVLGRREWAEALFVAYNRCHDHQQPLLCSSTSWPPETALADLSSRLASATVLQLKAPTHDELGTILQRKAQGLGLRLDPRIVTYLMDHHSRDATVLVQALRTLHSASLSAGKRLTLRFAQQQVQQW